MEALRQRGIPVVRRISGGGTVYHDLGNVNYTYIVRANGTVDYDAVLSPVIAALNAIGVPARKNRICDIAIGDLKISGSAQRMIKGRLLHHGTLLFSTDLGVLDQMVPPGCPRLTLTAEQEAEVCRLRDEKYRSWEQIFGRSPKFTIDWTGRFAGGKVQFKLDVQKGLIRDAAVYGDFFSTLDADTLCAALMGCPYERGAVLAALRSHGIDGAVYRISAEELASVVVD